MITIFLETGKNTTSEYHFVDDFVGKHLGIDSSKYSIECVGGKDNLENVTPKFFDNTILGGKNLIIFDADQPSNGGGYESRKDELKTKIKELGIEANLFLFPNNHDNGMFEDLLLHIIQEDSHKTFFDCYNDYERCLGEKYEHPNLKGKVFTYISSMKSLTNKARKALGSGDWQFTNNEYWNLDDDYLKPLADFIQASIE